MFRNAQSMFDVLDGKAETVIAIAAVTVVVVVNDVSHPVRWVPTDQPTRTDLPLADQTGKQSYVAQQEGLQHSTVFNRVY